MIKVSDGLILKGVFSTLVKLKFLRLIADGAAFITLGYPLFL